MENIGKIIRLSRPLYRKLLALSLLVLVMSVLQQVQPFLVKSIVDAIQQQIEDGNGNLATVTLLMAGIFGVNFAASVLNSLSMRAGDYIKSRLRRFLTEKFYKKVFTLPQLYFDSEISGKILNQLNRGIQSIQDFTGMMTNFVLPAFYQAFFTVGILMYYDITIGVLALLVFPLYILVSSYSTRKWGAAEVEKNKLEDISRGRIQEVIGNIRLVRGFMTQQQEWKLVSKTLAKVNVIYDKQSTLYHLINFFREFGLEIVIMVITLIVFRKTFTGTFTIGEMVLMLQLLNLIRRPLFAMGFILERIQQAESGSKEFFEVMDLESVEKVRLTPVPKSSLLKHPSLMFEDVHFHYEANSEDVLHSLSFEINPGETVALVGHSGAGKSTIINLILKYYEPTSGEIYIGDKKYSELDHAYIRSHISLVFQDNELFSTTVRENVAYGMSNVDDTAVVAALKKAHAYDFVMDLGGLDAEIGERGVKLSGGQKQRIQIARAIMHDAPILILDEATSSLDSKSESLVQEALDVLTKDKLVIVIAHRLSTLQNADRILVVDKGKLVDAGAPGSLAHKKGIYSELLKYQIEGNQKLLQKYGLHS